MRKMGHPEMRVASMKCSPIKGSHCVEFWGLLGHFASMKCSPIKGSHLATVPGAEHNGPGLNEVLPD